MLSRLQICTKPLRPTLLSLPTSPHSPRLPISPKPFIRSPSSPSGVGEAHRNTVGDRVDNQTPNLLNPPMAKEPPPPRDPLPWLWRCHICKRIYPLGTTRRCLDDGHYMCSGQPHSAKSASRRSSRAAKRRNAACASEFDYQGWKSYGDWRRGLQTDRGVTKTTTPDWSIQPSHAGGVICRIDCGNMCDYPSECRWSKQFLSEAPLATNTVENEYSEEEIRLMEIQLNADNPRKDAEGHELASDEGNTKCETLLNVTSQEMHTEAERKTDECRAIEEHLEEKIAKVQATQEPEEKLQKKSNSEKIFERTIRFLEKLGIKHQENKNMKSADRIRDFGNFFSNDVDDINIILIRNMAQHLQIELQGHSLKEEDRGTAEKDMALLKLLDSICTMTLRSRRATRV